MTWSEFTKKFGTPLSSINNTVSRHTANLELIQPLTDKCYDEYSEYFANKDIIQMDLPQWFAKNWILYEEEFFISRIDFHGLNRSETQYWLEYFEKNRHVFSKNVLLITGRGNNSQQRINRDISTVIIYKNDSTGILEDFVYRWLTQHRYRFHKRPGSFEVIS